ncbi:MAG: methyltransferase domain-containing protein [Proteobacteria bacterium]|nr:methyltransferase domain-containing protein [Pseudomonadota bacterium]
MNRLSKVSKTFSQAASTYDAHALIQKFVAQRLASKVLSQQTTPLGAVLEVGCGTGILSSHLASHANLYVLTDLSLPLLEKAHEKIKNDNVFPLVVDGEKPCFSASFDLIVSNLALHWLADPKGALTRLAACLKPGGRLYLSTLGNNTFHEWRTAHSLEDAPCGVLDFISFGQLKDWLPLSGTRHVEEEWVTTTPGDSLAFLRGLKAIGARLAHPRHKPLPYKTFKKVRDVYDKNPQISYQILYAAYQKPEKVREE